VFFVDPSQDLRLLCVTAYSRTCICACAVMPSALCAIRTLSTLIGDISTWSVIVPLIPDPPSGGCAIRRGVAAARWALLIKDCGSVVLALDAHLKVWRPCSLLPCVYLATCVWLLNPCLNAAATSNPTACCSQPII
jgi:hypothetical protein